MILWLDAHISPQLAHFNYNTTSPSIGFDQRAYFMWSLMLARRRDVTERMTVTVRLPGH